MFWTHIFDLLAKLLGVALAILIFSLEAPEQRQKSDLVILGLCFLVGGVVWWVGLRPLSSWLHARVRLGARLSWDQARRASMLFSPVRAQDLMQWHPLWEVRQLPEEVRVAAIESAMSQLLAEREAKAAHWRAAPVVSHFFRWLRWGGLALVVVMTFANWPPASWVSEFQARALDGNYYPALTAALLAGPGALLLAWLESLFGARSVTMVGNPPQIDGAEVVIPPAPEASATPLMEKETVVDPDDHSRFAPPPGAVSSRQG